jgi:hypothetical protein
MEKVSNYIDGKQGEQYFIETSVDPESARKILQSELKPALSDLSLAIKDRNVDNTIDQYNRVLSLSSGVIKLVTELNASPKDKIQNMFDFISKTSNEIFLSTFPNEVKPLSIDFPSTTGRSSLKFDKTTGELNLNIAQNKGTTLKLTLDTKMVQDLTIHGFSENKLLDFMKSMIDKNEISTERQIQLLTNTFKCYQSQVNCYNDIINHTSCFETQVKATQESLKQVMNI